MNNIISVAMKNLNGEYLLEEKEDGGLTVKAPCINQDEEDNDVIEHNIIEVEKGKKAEIVRQFFKENATTIIRGGVAFNLDSILFDESELPDFVEPDIITY